MTNMTIDKLRELIKKLEDIDLELEYEYTSFYIENKLNRCFGKTINSLKRELRNLENELIRVNEQASPDAIAFGAASEDKKNVY